MGKQEISKIENFNVNALEEIKGKEKLIESVIKENPFVKIVDNKTYEEGKKSRTALRTCRTDLEKEEKALHNAVKKVLTEPIKNIYGTFKEKVTPLEDKQQEEVKAWEDVKEQERQEKLRIEEARKQKHRDNIELFFNLNKIIIEDLTFETIRHELVFLNDDQEFTSESFEEFADVFEAKVDVLTTMLKEKINTLQEKENIRLENERLENERKENERKQKIKTSIDYFYTTWQDMFADMRFEDIKEVSLNFNSEKPLDCAEFQEDYAQKRANLVRMLEAKTNFLTQAENQRIQQEKLDREQAELDQLNKDLEAKQKKLEGRLFECDEEGKPISIITSEGNKPLESQVNEIEVVADEVVSGNTEEVIIFKNGVTEVSEEVAEVMNTFNKVDEEIIHEVEFEEISLIDLLLKAKSTICSLKLSMLAHPDCTEGSEFDDYTSLAQETEDELENYINK